MSISELHPWPSQRRLLPDVWRMWVTALFEVPVLGAFVQTRRGIVRCFLTRDAQDSPMWSDERVDSYAIPTARPAIARAGQRMHAAFVLREIARLVSRRDHRRRFDTPTLLITGDRDAYIPPALLAIPAKRAQMLRVQTVHGGHFILDENPEAVTSAIRAHLTQVRSSSTVG